MKLRITLLIVLTLLLGFVIGMLTSAQLRHKKMRPVRIYASEKYFKERIYKVIEPSDDQMAKLDEIIVKYGEEIQDLNKEFRKNFEDLLDKQWNEIKPVLNREQIEKLEEMQRNRRRAMKEYDEERRSHRNERYNDDHHRGDRRSPGFERSRGDTIKDTNQKSDSLDIE